PEPEVEPEVELELLGATDQVVEQDAECVPDLVVVSDEIIESEDVQDAPDLDSEHDLYLEFDMELEPEDRSMPQLKAVAEPLVNMSVENLLSTSASLVSDSGHVDGGPEAEVDVNLQAEETPAIEDGVPFTELTIEEIMAPVEQVMAVQLEEAKKEEPLQEQPAPGTDGVPAQEQLAADEEEKPKVDFFDEPHRELEMPPKKKGFFARLFG
ncbi:MAG: hypothetical protein IJI68_07175, partial [Eggerthellaceae bacterium]|nr:hypothetical protein [Eggerthellaceae bacterium]